MAAIWVTLFFSAKPVVLRNVFQTLLASELLDWVNCLLRVSKKENSVFVHFCQVEEPQSCHLINWLYVLYLNAT